MSTINDYSELEKPVGNSGLPVVESGEQKSECRLYGRRWFMLILFVFYSMSNSMQWIQFSIINNIVVRYYNVSSFVVDWTSMIYMVTYVPLILPASWLLDKLGTRIAIILGSIGTFIGSCVKVFSVAPDRFLITFIGQTIVAISQTFIVSLPARLAAVWFGQNEVSTACSIGVFGNQFGVALGFLLPPMIVRMSDDPSVIENGLRLMYFSVAIFTAVILGLILIFFEDKPPLPPSPAQAAQNLGQKDGGFFQSLNRLMNNNGYILLLLSYGISVGVFYAISTLLNQVILMYFPDQEEDAGRIGLLIVLTGMVGSVCCGYLLDKTRLFKEITLAVYICSVVGMLGYTFTLGCGSIIIVYLTSSLLGFFMTGYLPLGFELAIELTYPEPEGTSAGIINASVQVFGIIFTMMYGWLINVLNDLWANICLIVMLLIGTLLTAFIPSDLRRQTASQSIQ